MKNYVVAAVDGSQARFFSVKPRQTPEVESGPKLVETGSMRNEVGTQPDREVFANDKGRNKAPNGGGGHGYDDHRDDHQEEFLKRFAERVADAIAKEVERQDILVLAAETHMIGILRKVLSRKNLVYKELREYRQEATKLAPHVIQQRLAEEGLVPECQGPTQATRFRSA